MVNRLVPRLLLGPLLLVLGCSLTGGGINQELEHLTDRIGDEDGLASVQPGLPAPPPSSVLPASLGQGVGKGEMVSSLAGTPLPAPWPKSPASVPSSIQQVRFQQEEKGKVGLPNVPSALPGANAPEIQLPRDPEARRRAIREMFPPVEPLPPEPPLPPGPEGRPLSLAALQQLGKTYSPAIKHAIAAVEAARAAAYQAGMYPNPYFGYEHDTAETGPAGYPGGFLDQLIKTGGKLTVAQAAATMDVLTAKLALRKAIADMRTQVRGHYFAVLVAQENMRVSEAMFHFLNEIYQVQVAHAAGGIEPTAPYDPMQLRPTVLQAQLYLITARNAYHAAWRQLAAVIGLPDMCPSQLEGSATGPIPCLDYKEILKRLDKHTDVLSAEVAIYKAKYNLQLAKLVPLPDVDVRVLVQKDYTAPPNQVVHSFVLNMPIPLWDQNRGGIRQAQWQLSQASVGPANARNALVGTLAEAYGRYLTARKQVEITTAQLADQIRFFRGERVRWNTNPQAVGLVDLYVAQQTLAGYLAGYLTALGVQWQAVVDVANLLQAEDLFAAGPPLPMPAIPDLNCLQAPPSPVPDPPGPLSLFPKSASTAVIEESAGPVPEGPPVAPPPPPPPSGPMPGQVLPIAPPAPAGKEQPDDQ